MLRCIVFLGALLALPAFAQTSDTAASPPATDVSTAADVAPTADTATPAATMATPEGPTAPAAAPEMTPEQKLTQYRHDQINLLALRGDAGSLLSAALMARIDADDKRRPAALKTPALLKRAQTAGADTALVWWVAAASECVGAAKPCSRADVLQKLESLDPENAAVWLWTLANAQQAKDAPATRAALASAAQAKRYNDYFGALISAIYQAQDVLPMSADLLTASQVSARVEGYRLVYAANLAVSVAAPPYKALMDACKPANPPDQALVQDCIAVARNMEQGGTLIARRLGLKLHDSLAVDGPELDAVHAHERTLAWQISRINDLDSQLASDDRVTRVYTDALAESGDEAAGVLAVLRSQHVPLEPAADWQPPPPDTTPAP